MNEDPGRRRRDPEATRARILKAATAEFARHGFAGARRGPPTPPPPRTPTKKKKKKRNKKGAGYDFL